jgi:hypothetical protein
MGVYIKGMETPKSCRDCRFCCGQANTDYGVCAWCDVDGKARDAYTMQDCPLVPVPPHGRLIDAYALVDTLMKLADNEYTPKVFASWMSYEENAPTIIPAEEGE